MIHLPTVPAALLPVLKVSLISSPCARAYRSIASFCSGRETPFSPCRGVDTRAYAKYLPMVRLIFQRKLRPFFHRSEEHTSELQSRGHLVCRLLLEKKKKI